MKSKVIVFLIVVVVAGLLGGCAPSNTTGAVGEVQEKQAAETVEDVRMPIVQVQPLGVTLKAKEKILFAGVGFPPNSDINVYITMGQAVSNICYQLGNPKTNEEGAFTAVWVLDKGEVGLLEPGVHDVPVFVEGDNRIAYVPIVFIKEEKKE